MGDYDYRVTAVRLRRAGLEVDGSLGEWKTTMVVEPKDLAPVVKGLALLVPLGLLLRRLR